MQAVLAAASSISGKGHSFPRALATVRAALLPFELRWGTICQRFLGMLVA